MFLSSLQFDLRNLEQSQETKFTVLKKLRETRAVETDVLEQQKLDLQIKTTRSDLLRMEEEATQIENQIKLLTEKESHNKTGKQDNDVIEEISPDEWSRPKTRSRFRRFFDDLFDDN